nr:glycoside hydrolase family 3 N-terminal domain-containing protein [uncultured Acetatifactor sp.]
MEKYKNASLSPKERAEDLLGRMSLEEKMGQVNCLFPYGDNWDVVEKDMEHGIGQVSTLDVRMIKSLDEAAAWQRRIQKRVIEKSEHGVPAVFHMEGLCGPFIQDSMSFPSGISRGSSWNPELEEKVGEVVGRQELSCGITQILAPVLDISRDSRMGRQGETYGEDPTLAAALGAAYVRGIQNQTVAGRKAESVAKHFLGFHNSQGGIHGANCDIPDRLLEEVYAKPFQAAISEAGLRGIMPCYCSVNGEPVSASEKILTGLLRERMGFDGICASDYGAVGNVHNTQKMCESVTEAGLLCMEAGMDVEMQNCQGFNGELQEWFRAGRADIGVLDRAVLRILEAKFRMGLFEHPYALGGEELRKSFTGREDSRISLQSALESMVLIKNNGALPLKADIKKIAVIGCHAANARSLFGGYTHLSMAEAVHAVANSIAGLESGSVKGKELVTVPGTQIQSDETEEFDEILRHQKPDCPSILEKLRERLKGVEIGYAYGYAIAGNDLSHMAEALKLAEEVDIILMTLGGKHGSCSVASMGEGVDATDINLPECQEEFIKRAAKLGKPMVGIHLNGRPISSDVADTCLDAILEAWNPSEMGAEAIVQVLTGEYNPGGKLPVCVARNAGQIPIYYNHQNGSAWHQGGSIGFAEYVDMPHTPRYFFGHGLSYTEFFYNGLHVAQDTVNPEDTVEISVEIENTGKRKGDEIVQLYLRDVYASMTRPVKELAGFKRITLEPGETKTVCFRLQCSQTAFLDSHMQWKVEKGEIEVQIGSSSEDIRQRGSFHIMEDKIVDGKSRGMYAAAEVR